MATMEVPFLIKREAYDDFIYIEHPLIGHMGFCFNRFGEDIAEMKREWEYAARLFDAPVEKITAICMECRNFTKSFRLDGDLNIVYLN